MNGIIRTVCFLVPCLVFFCAVIPSAEAKVAGNSTASKPFKPKMSVKQSPPREQVVKKQPLKALVAKRNVPLTRRQRSKPTQTPITARILKKQPIKDSKVKTASLRPSRKGNSKPPRVPIMERLPTLELPEEILSAELADDAMPVEEIAYSLLGARYRFGGSSISGIDCSAFVQRVYSFLKITIPRTAREQFGIGIEIPQDEVQKGDLVFFQTYAKFPSHVAIYLGDNRMIHASSGSRRVTISNMNTPYYSSRYLGARRLQGSEGEQLSRLLAGL